MSKVMPMQKPWFESKTVWAGVFLILGALGFCLTGNPEKGYELFFTGLGLIGLRQAVE